MRSALAPPTSARSPLAPPAPPAPAVDASPSPAPRVGATAGERKILPPTWRQLVDAWKQQKPLQARKLEEANPVEYTPERIVLSVSADSFASKALLNKDEQTKIRDQFKEVFGFAGALVVVTQGAIPDVAAPVLPDSVLTERGRESASRREQLTESALQAPFTRDLTGALGGTVSGVRFPEGGPGSKKIEVSRGSSS